MTVNESLELEWEREEKRERSRRKILEMGLRQEQSPGIQTPNQLFPCSLADLVSLFPNL